jgi:hypothetical protein
MSRTRTQSPAQQKPVEPLSFDAWQQQAIMLIPPPCAALLRRILHQQWTQWYVRLLSPQQAAKEAESEIWNTMSPAERLRYRAEA